MKVHEAAAFIAAFQNEPARTLVMEMMVHNYVDAILLHHPQSNHLEKRSIEENCHYLVQTLFAEIEGIQSDPSKLQPLLVKLSRNHSPMASFWFESFNKAYDAYRHEGKLKMKAEQLRPYLQGETYCDIGCGGGDLVAYLKAFHPQFRTTTGIDIMDWRTEELKDRINFQLLDFSKPGTESTDKYDFATCMAVLHHVGNDDASRKRFLRNIRNVISKNGRMVIEEDVLLPKEEIDANEQYKLQVSRRSNEHHSFARYAALSTEEQRSALILIDLLANSLIVGVPDMAFPFGFKTINGWTNLFIECGYALMEVQIKGFTRGMFNQSAHVHFVLMRN